MNENVLKWKKFFKEWGWMIGVMLGIGVMYIGLLSSVQGQKDELEWCQKTLHDECGDLCNCNPHWYMSEMWSLEMQYNTFGSIPIEICNEEVDEAVDAFAASWRPEWEECTETLSECIIEEQTCRWNMEKSHEDDFHCYVEKLEDDFYNMEAYQLEPCIETVVIYEKQIQELWDERKECLKSIEWCTKTIEEIDTFSEMERDGAEFHAWWMGHDYRQYGRPFLSMTEEELAEYEHRALVKELAEILEVKR